MNKVLKVGIAGYGIVGKRRRKFIDKHPNMTTVAICDKYFEQHNHKEDAPNDDVKVYTNYKDLLKYSEIDILFVCLTNDIAAEVTIAGLKHNLHVFCEKPPGRSVEDIQDVILAEAERPDLKLKYGFNHRYHKSIHEAQQIISSGDLGEIINLRGIYGKSIMISYDSTWRAKREIAGGGILLDQGIHMIDLIRYFGGEFDEIKSFVSNSFWNYDVEDNAFALMRSTNTGRVAMLHSTATEWRHRFELTIALTKGTIVLSGILSSTKSYGQESLKVVFKGDNDKGDPREQTTTYIEDPSWEREINEFADSIMQNTPIKHGTSADALKSMQLVYDIYKQDNQWKTKFDL